MRASIRNLSVCLALAASSPSWATASFANWELGAGAGVFSLQPPDAARVSWAPYLTLEGGFYISSGFALYLKLPFMLVRQTNNAYAFGFGGQFGVRYLFLEESIRPYLMLHLAGFGVARAEEPNFFIGPGTGVGIDFFVSDSVSLGLRATVDLFLTIVGTEIKPQFSLGGAGSFTTYF